MSAETVGQALLRGAGYLERRGVESALRNARFLLAHALGGDVPRLVAALDQPLADAAARQYGVLLCSRGSREPLQYLLGRWEFWGLDLEVGPQALIPRPETETLVERVLAEIPREPALLVDVGTGTGAIALALARERPQWRLIATDVSPAALELARRNVAALGLLERIELCEGDLLDALAGRPETGALDAVVSNPPYVTEAEYATLAPELMFEPRPALVPGPTGLECYQRLIPQAAVWLRPGGLLALEVGAGQAEAVAAICRDSGGFGESTLTRDLSGIARVVTARRR